MNQIKAHKDILATPKIRIANLTKQFPTADGLFTAIDNISIDIAAGTFFVIVGPSGCGKTTLLRILGDLETPSSGSVEVYAEHPGKPGNSMVFQGDSIFPWMTVWENAAYGLKLRGVPDAQVRETVGHYLDKTGLTKFAKRYPYQLSGGMKQRVSIARAFANDPEILLMDEPFSALDEQNKTLLQEEILRIWEEDKKTVVFITHSVDEAVTLGDQIMVMSAHPGKVKAVIDVPFERPREVFELRSLPAYGEMVFQIWGYLRDEVQQAKAQEEART
ncbi:ABC transporter ATP-binding protein [Paralcaligenes ureilyticus]|uniref:NitT/TauT family transport system ATP-binding protein n=1 Tax=Paralcaligenes ureilyticus TaxID=627131 RepID=A0A4R3LXF2_9BURK|nr:ABC transporter ATP-binding protein [Paralcaligenes ureilyticus]TCT05292.1 NitT/TauT family transport system ATP-binding protein [Paralcaligenes ureilyticus]